MTSQARLLRAVRRGVVRRPFRAAICTVAVIVAIVLGMPAAVLLAALALVLVLDAVVPMPGPSPGEADARFRHLTRHHSRTDRLEVVDEGAPWVLSAERRALGVQLIEIETVTGTVELAKANEFDRQFRPDGSEPVRWKGLWLAHMHTIALPPVSVYRIGTRHILRDGHHRVSVARDRGIDVIEADVIELRPRGPVTSAPG